MRKEGKTPRETPATRDASGTNTLVGVENGSLNYHSLFYDKELAKQLRREKVYCSLPHRLRVPSRQRYGGRGGGHGHTASMVGKQRDMMRGSASFLLLSPGPQPTAWCCPHLGQVAPFQLNLSGNTHTDTSRGF